MSHIIYTVFLHGTLSGAEQVKGNAQFEEGELISFLASTYGKTHTEYCDYVELNGPGATSGEFQESYQKQAKDLGISYYSQFKNYAFGTATGAGWSTNVNLAYELIAGKSRLEDVNRYRRSNPISIVNIVGWSRGGITAIMLANKLAKSPDTQNLIINIIAVDPVGGPFDMGGVSTSTLPPQVRNFVGFYARDERSRFFASTIPKMHGGKITTYLMPGTHTHVVGDVRSASDVLAKAGQSHGPKMRNDDLILDETAQIVRSRSINYLMKWGSSAEGFYSTPDETLLLIYDHMLSKVDTEYLALQSTNLGTGQSSLGSKRNYRRQNIFRSCWGNYADLSKSADNKLNGWEKMVFINRDHSNLFLGNLPQSHDIAPITSKLYMKYEGT